MIDLLFAAILGFAQPVTAEPAETYPEIDAARVELCYVHSIRDIRNMALAGGNVPGPAWFVRDWWGEQLPASLSGEQQEVLIGAVDARAITDEDAVEAEAIACTHQALDGGAWPPG